MLQAIERYMKQAIVDKVPSVSSSALVSSLVSEEAVFLLSGWVNETQGLGRVLDLNSLTSLYYSDCSFLCISLSASQPGLFHSHALDIPLSDPAMFVRCKSI